MPGNVNGFTFGVFFEQIATHPGSEYNPLFLYGHVGAEDPPHQRHRQPRDEEPPNARVGYVSASHFARRLKDAIAENALDAFRESSAHWDILILDDIQFLAGARRGAGRVLATLFNALLQQA